MIALALAMTLMASPLERWQQARVRNAAHDAQVSTGASSVVLRPSDLRRVRSVKRSCQVIVISDGEGGMHPRIVCVGM